MMSFFNFWGSTETPQSELNNITESIIIQEKDNKFSNLIKLDCKLSGVLSKNGLLDELIKLNPDKDEGKLIFSSAVLGGHYNVLEWAFVNKYECSADAISFAALKGDIEMIKYLRIKGCPWSQKCLSYAAMNGDIKVISFLRDTGCPWDSRVTSYAAFYGHFEALKYAWSNGCPWDASVCTFSALNKKYEILKWAVLNGCPTDPMCCSYVIAYGDFEMFRWLVFKKVKWSYDTCSICSTDDYCRLKDWCHENSCDIIL